MHVIEENIKQGENAVDHFGSDIGECWSFNYTANLDYAKEVVSEDEIPLLRKMEMVLF